MGNACTNKTRKRQWEILHGASRQKMSKVILMIINAGLNVGADLSRHDVCRVIVCMHCEPKLSGGEFLGRLINFSRKASRHEVRYF
jgi:hypothetical protein